MDWGVANTRLKDKNSAGQDSYFLRILETEARQIPKRKAGIAEVVIRNG